MKSLTQHINESFAFIAEGKIKNLSPKMQDFIEKNIANGEEYDLDVNSQEIFLVDGVGKEIKDSRKKISLIKGFPIKESFITEDAKDDSRIKGIIDRSKGSDSKAEQLAKNMAKSIKDKHKLERRYKAAVNMLGEDHVVSIAFAEAFAKIGGDSKKSAKSLKDPKAIPGSKLPKSQQKGRTPKSNKGDNKNGYGSNSRPNPILPVGVLNLATGKNKYFNIKTNGQATVEVWKDYYDKYRFVITSGSGPIYAIGSTAFFAHDQTGRPLFEGVMVDYIDAAYTENIIDLYGKSGSGYVYK